MNDKNEPDSGKNDVRKDVSEMLEKHKQRSQGGKAEIMRALGLITQLGISMVVCVLIGFVTGRYLDQWLGTSPWFLLLFSFIGAGAAIKVLFDMATKESD